MMKATALCADCIMHVTARRGYAAQELRIHVLPDRPEPGARGRVVEHSDPARCLPRADALRPVPEEPGHRAEHADATPERAGRIRPAGAPPLQRASAALRVCSDRPWPRF